MHGACIHITYITHNAYLCTTCTLQPLRLGLKGTWHALRAGGVGVAATSHSPKIGRKDAPRWPLLPATRSYPSYLTFSRLEEKRRASRIPHCTPSFLYQPSDRKLGSHMAGSHFLKRVNLEKLPILITDNRQTSYQTSSRHPTNPSPDTSPGCLVGWNVGTFKFVISHCCIESDTCNAFFETREECISIRKQP